LNKTKNNIALPIKFQPIFKEKIWGGNKFSSVLNKDLGNIASCGESWEISCVDEDISIVAEGILKGQSLVQLIKSYNSDLLGAKVYEKFGENFPLLIKFLDANQDLSIQVHPNDDLALQRHGSFGKTEMWYVVEADYQSSIIFGFNQEMNKEKFLNYFNDGKLLEILNTQYVKKEDVFYLPAGKIHTIGKGLLIAEIQQTSDLTYRIFDYNRKDKHGELRELHLEDALAAIDYSYDNTLNSPSSNTNETLKELVDCKYFTTNKLIVIDETYRDYNNLDSFKILICVEGKGEILYDGGKVSINLGDVYLIPACLKEVSINSISEKVTLLETYIS